MTSALILVANVSSSLVQPLFGYLSDRSTKAWLLPFGVIAATCGMASVGLAGSYPMLLVLILISGIGLPATIPKPTKPRIFRPAPKRRPASRCFRSVGISAWAWGPLAVVLCLAALGPRGLLLLWIPG